MKKALLSLLTAAVLILLGCSTARGIYPPNSSIIKTEGLKSYVEPWEDGLRTNPEGESFEWWYFDVSFKDGSTAVIVFSTKSILKPSGKPDPQVSIVITTKNGKKISDSDNPGFNNFYAFKDKCYVKIGQSSVEGNLKTYMLHYSHNSIEADLNFISKAPAWRPGDGKMYFDSSYKKYFAWLPSVPYADITGSLTYNGTTKEVTGSGYHDHNWGNVRLNDVITQWYWGRAHIGDYTTIFSETLTSSKYGKTKAPVFYLAKGGKILSSDSFKMKSTPSQWTTHSGGREYPEKMVIEIQQKKGKLVLTLSKSRIIEARSLIDNMPSFVQFFIRLFSNPYYFRFNTDMSIAGSINGQKLNESGSAIFEMMHLKGKHTVH